MLPAAEPKFCCLQNQDKCAQSEQIDFILKIDLGLTNAIITTIYLGKCTRVSNAKMKLNSYSRINAPALLAPSAAMLHSARGTFLESHISNSLRTSRPAQQHKLCVAQASTGDASTPQPVEDRRSGRTTYRPSSFTELLGDAVQAVVAGLEDGLTRMEVEFPAVSNVDGKNNKIIIIL